MKNPKSWDTFVAQFPVYMKTFAEYKRICDMFANSIYEASNILVYSAPGFPLQLLWNYVATCTWGNVTSKNRCSYKEVVYLETPYFFEIDFEHPANTKLLDILQEFVKTVISSSCIHARKHIFVCKNIDAIENKYAFRVLLERYSDNAMFICMTHSVSTIEPPLRSRLFHIRVPLFTHEQIAHIVATIQTTTIHMASRNIYKILFLIDDENNMKQDVATYNYPEIAKIPAKPSMQCIRDISNKVCNVNVPLTLVAMDLLHRIPEKHKASFVARAAEIEHMLIQTNQGRRPLYYELLFQAACVEFEK
jgi:hypothetical protein